MTKAVGGNRKNMARAQGLRGVRNKAQQQAAALFRDCFRVWDNQSPGGSILQFQRVKALPLQTLGILEQGLFAVRLVYGEFIAWLLLAIVSATVSNDIGS